MITQQEQEKVTQNQNRLEEMKKTVKSFQKYLIENCQEQDTHNKKIFGISKQYQQQISFVKDDPLNLWLNVSETIQMFDYSAKTVTQQQTDFQTFFTQAFEDYYEKQGAQSKKVNDLNFNNLKQMLAARQGYEKARSKYEKLCKEVELSLLNQKKSSNEANSGYNVELANKTEIRIMDTYKQIQVAEQVYKDQTEAVQVKTKEFQDGLIESQIHLKQVFKYSNEKLIEITMKQDQHNLLSLNWIKGHIDEKLEQIVKCNKLDSAQEDLLIQSKIDENQQDLVMKQTNIKYADIMSKLLTSGEIQDLEFNMYPDVLSKFIDTQMNLIQERIKNLRTLGNFVNDIAQLQDQLQKQITKITKNSSQLLQEIQMNPESSLYGKKLLQVQDMFSNFHETYSKKIYQLSQFLQMKQQNIETLIKDQKAQEKSFINMYTKMHKDILTIRNQIQVSLFEGGDTKQLLLQRDALQKQLKKIIKEGAPILNFSIDQIRQVENQRAHQVSNIIEGMVQLYSNFIDETIKSTKVQEEFLNKRYDIIEQEISLLPLVTLPTDVPEFTFTQNIQITEVMKQHAELVAVSATTQQQLDDEDDQNLAEGAVKVGVGLLGKFNLTEADKCLASYACAFDNKILLQGRLYIFSSRICFHSYFNAKTLFGTTVLVIPPSDVQTIRKAKAYLFDNAIEIQTKKGSLVFASFVNREQTLSVMRQLKGFVDGVFEPQEEKLIQASSEDSAIKLDQIQEFTITPQKDSIVKQQSKGSPQQIDNISIVLNTPQTVRCQQVEVVLIQKIISVVLPKVQEELPTKLHQEIMVAKKAERIMIQPTVMKWNIDMNISVKNLTEHLFLNKPYTHQGKQYQSFFQFIQLTVGKDRDLTMQPYPEPDWDSQVPYKRTVGFVHPVREKVMFAPESATCSAIDHIYLFNHNEMLAEREVAFSKIPYGDHFKFKSYYHLKSKGEGCTLEYGFYVQFVKKTVWQGKIESSSKQENIELWEKNLKVMIQREASNFMNQQNLNNLASRGEDEPLIEEKQVLMLEQIEMLPNISDIGRSLATNIQSDNQNTNLMNKIDKQTQILYVLIGLVVLDILVRLFQ